MEDRFSAIRAAIGTAGPGDVVVILGRGHKDYMEYGAEDRNGSLHCNFFSTELYVPSVLWEAACINHVLPSYQVLRAQRPSTLISKSVVEQGLANFPSPRTTMHHLSCLLSQTFAHLYPMKDTTVLGWFDDRVEARSALSKLTYLDQLSDLSRNKLPWGSALDDMETVIGE
eukprot:1161742-Pelagomonas_calceolata.AAC.3